VNDDFAEGVVGDRHLNLFYTYQTRRLEDNVTRAFVITLRNLSPTHLRLFLQDVVLAKRSQGVPTRRLHLIAEGDFDFSLQVSPSEEDRLNAETGIIVGINFSGKQFPTLDAASASQGGARPDALVTDTANNLTVIFEAKLHDTLYREQIQRHFGGFFTEFTNLNDVFIEITWSEIATFLHRVAKQSTSDRERFVALEFIRYLDWLRLVDFIGFSASDFITQPGGELSSWKLNRFLIRMADSLRKELGLREYRSDWKLFFDDVPNENLWVSMSERGINSGIVCGSGKMWRAQQMRDYIEGRPSTFRHILDTLRQTLGEEFAITLRIHAYFRHSRFRTAWLGDVGGRIYSYPGDYDNFVATLSDRRVNAFEYLPKRDIQERFSLAIKQNIDEGLEVDEQGRFPKWEDLDSFLQYAYFHDDVEIPVRRLVGRSLEDLLGTFKGVLNAEHSAMQTMATLHG
jgi:hypothetical protein